MRRTSPAVVFVAAGLGAVIGFFVDSLLTGWGRPTFAPAVTLPILLVLLGALVVALAVPIARATRGRAQRVNPFRALRVAMLAKASTIVGAVVGGFAVGLLSFLLTRDAVPSLGSMATIIATAASGAVLVAAGLVAEQLCTIRKDDDDDQPGQPGA